MGALRSATSGGTLRVEGLAALQRDLNRVNKTAKGEVRDGLKEVGRIVSDQAQLIAMAKGLNKTGQLVRRIVPTVRQQGVFVEAKAKKKSKKYPGGYRYPAIYEFDPRRARPFLWPAAETSEAQVERAMDRWLDTFLSKNDL
ncbi:MAG: hypothetical protein ACO3HV_07045 [Candidatus Nanopelagicales bacterium]